MICIYVHTHWAYNHPYAARTWTMDDWRGFLGATKAIGYDSVSIWPQCDTMPIPPTPSDMAFLDKIGRVIDMAHHEFGMKVLITSTPNVFYNEKSPKYTFEDRSFFDVCRNIDPKNKAEIETMMRQRETVWKPLVKADGIVIIDSDPGGWPDSPSSDFVEFFRLQGELFRKMNPKATIYFWMHAGWPVTESLVTHLETLSIMKQKIDWPWKIFTTTDAHQEASDQHGLGDRRVYNPYGLVETEPSFPLLNCNVPYFRQEMQKYDPRVYPEGIILNAQTHCIQIPRLYLGAHYARGGTVATEKLMALAEKLVPGIAGVRIGTAWHYMEDDRDLHRMRLTARQLRLEREKSHKPGPLAGLMMMPPEQYMLDMADNLDIRADFIELRIALESGREIKKALRQLMSHIRPYRDRIGYNHICWDGPLRKRLFDPLIRLGIPALSDAIWPPAGITPGPKGYLVNVFDAIETYANS